jgi:chemotaxis-related protein WspD
MSENCWKEIGVIGDRTCLELKKYIHCRNCPIYAVNGRSLLERDVPQGYLDEWTNLLRSTEPTTITVAPSGTISVGIFRLAGEWLALKANLFKEVTSVSVIHTLPHRSNNIFMGLVSIRGEILMCISLKELLGLESEKKHHQNVSPVVYKRMVVIERDGSRWVFPVDEIYGIHRIHPDELGNVPSTVSKVPETYSQGIITWQKQSVCYLEDEFIFYSLKKKVL